MKKIISIISILVAFAMLVVSCDASMKEPQMVSMNVSLDTAKSISSTVSGSFEECTKWTLTIKSEGDGLGYCSLGNAATDLADAENIVLSYGTWTIEVNGYVGSDLLYKGVRKIVIDGLFQNGTTVNVQVERIMEGTGKIAFGAITLSGVSLSASDYTAVVYPIDKDTFRKTAQALDASDYDNCPCGDYMVEITYVCEGVSKKTEHCFSVFSGATTTISGSLLITENTCCIYLYNNLDFPGDYKKYVAKIGDSLEFDEITGGVPSGYYVYNEYLDDVKIANVDGTLIPGVYNYTDENGNWIRSIETEVHAKWEIFPYERDATMDFNFDLDPDTNTEFDIILHDGDTSIGLSKMPTKEGYTLDGFNLMGNVYHALGMIADNTGKLLPNVSDVTDENGRLHPKTIDGVCINIVAVWSPVDPT